MTRPAEESASPVDSAAPELAVLEPDSSLEEPVEEESSELPVLEASSLPVAEDEAAEPVSLPVPVTIVALSGASRTTVVELPTDTSKEVKVREMLMRRWVTPTGRPAGMVATEG